MTRVHQVLSGAGPFDAVTTQAFEFQQAFSNWGMSGGVFAAAIEPAVRERVQAVERLQPDRHDLLLFHYSAYAPRLEPLLDLPQSKLLVYHNVTPPEWLWEQQPHVATLCALGRDHLPRWVSRVDVTAAVSEYNAAELRDAGAREVRVVPILFNAARVRDGAARRRRGPARILSVGRLAPHKRPDLVLRAFELYRAACDEGARLDMVGEALSPGYEATLRQAAGRGVVIHGRLEQAQLNTLWRNADAFLTLSEHEGFCIPLLEAFATDTPVIARPVGGMPEVGGDAVLWAEDRDLAVVAELIDLAVRDRELHASLVARGHARLSAYSPEVVLRRLLEAVSAAGA